MTAETFINPNDPNGLEIIDPRNPAPAPGQPRPPQLLALTSIRFFAALYVGLYHLVRPFTLWGPFAGFMSAGYIGVSFFFLLSGFILTYSHAGEAQHGAAFVKRFYFARFARIYPVYLLALLAAGYVYRYQFAQPIHGLAFVADLLMVQAWSVRMVSYFNIPAWSVSSEVFFYLVFPFVFLRLRPARRGAAIGAIVTFWCVAMIMPVIATLYFPRTPLQDFGGVFTFWIRRFPLFSLPEFLAGISLAWIFLLFRPGRRAAVWMALGSGVALLLLLFFAAYLPPMMLHNGLLLPLYALLLLGLSEDSVLTRSLSWPPLVLLGEASYALYLMHYLLAEWMGGTFGIDTGLKTVCLKLAILIPLSIALHLFVERPCRKGLLRWWNRRHPRRGAA